MDPTLYKHLVGSLYYLTCTRPDIIYAIGVVNRYMENPMTTHLKVAKKILSHRKGTTSSGFYYFVSDDYKLDRYNYSD